MRALAEMQHETLNHEYSETQGNKTPEMHHAELVLEQEQCNVM
jgi:hypothetical protein